MTLAKKQSPAINPNHTNNKKLPDQSPAFNLLAQVSRNPAPTKGEIKDNKKSKEEKLVEENNSVLMNSNETPIDEQQDNPHISRGFPKIEWRLNSPPNSPNPKETKAFKESLQELVSTYKKFLHELGIYPSNSNPITFEPATKKIIKILQMLTLLARIEEKAALAGINYQLEIIAELQRFYYWFTDKDKFTDEDKKLITILKNKRQSKGYIHSVKMLQTLDDLINKQYTPYVLRNLIFALRALGELHQSKATRRPIPTDIEDIVTNLKDRLQKHNDSLKKGTLDNKLLNALEYIDKCDRNHTILMEPSKAKTLGNKPQQASSNFFVAIPLPENINDEEDELEIKNQAVKKTYYYSEQVILTLRSILEDPGITMDELSRRYINQIFSYYLSINQLALGKSEELQYFL